MFHLVNLKSGSKYELRVSYPATVSKTDAFLSTFCSLARAWEGGGVLPKILGGGVPCGSQNLTLFQTET